jgi:hypothetical protein
LSREWAEQAARLLFGEAEVPDEDKIVSFTTLCLFWYGQGDWPRAIVHEGNALIHLRLTGLSEAERGTTHSLQSESRCRRFWGTYIINQFVSEPTTTSFFSSAAISKVRLPCEEGQYESGQVSSSRVTLRDETRTPSIFAEVVRITALW